MCPSVCSVAVCVLLGWGEGLVFFNYCFWFHVVKHLVLHLNVLTTQYQ